MRTLLAKLLLYLFAALPLRLNRWAGVVIGRLMYVLPNRLRSIAAINLALCLPRLDDPARAALLRRHLLEVGKGFAEIGPMWLWSRPRVLALVHDVEGVHLLEQARANGRGVVLAVPHLGCWEMVGLYCSAHYPMTSLYRPPRLAGFDTLMRRARQRLGATLVPTDARGVRALYQALARGDLCAILPDQVPTGGNGVFADFFGQPAYTMTLAARLAHKSGAQLVFAWAERLPGVLGYRLHFSAAADPLPEDLQQGVQLINSGIEACIRRCLAQYQWGYKRFRTWPPGQTPPY